MEFVLELQNLQAAEMEYGGGSGHGGATSTLSVALGCHNSTLSVVLCDSHH